MHRATPIMSSFRGYCAGGARCTIDQIDDKQLMQEHAGNQMKGETRDKIESPQNYGFTSVVMDADKDSNGQMTGSAEGFMSYPGGNRSFAYCGVMDDRRHRLNSLDKGDVAMFRTKDDNQQFHLTTDGGFWSAPTDKTVRMQLVKKQQQQGQGQQASQHDASGGAAPGGQGGQQGQGQQKGQRAVRKNSSHQYVDVTENATNVSGTNTYMRLQDGKGYLHCSDDAKVWVGAEKGKATFARLLTENGPSVNSYGNLGSGSKADDRTVDITDPPPAGTAPPDSPDFPPPEIPERCFYTETTWHDAHTAADAWDDFHGNHGYMLDQYTPAPFKFIRSDNSGEQPASMRKGSLGLNGADGILSWLNSSGGIEQAALRNIASVPGLLALMQITDIQIFATPGDHSVTFDQRTKKVLALAWGASAGTGSPGTSNGGNGENTQFDGFYAAGGTAANESDPDIPAVPGTHGSGSGGDLNLVGCGASAPLGGTGAGNGGLAIKFLDVTGWGGTGVHVGNGGAAGNPGGKPGYPGGALIIEMT
jgi:phage gp45-like